MSAATKLAAGTVAWFDMVGSLMFDAASRAGHAPGQNWSLVERYSDGSRLPNGRLKGLRFDIVDGLPSYQVGVDEGERGDLLIEVSAAVAQELNRLYIDDPAYARALERATRAGHFTVHGDLSRAPAWLRAIHDPIVDRTA